MGVVGGKITNLIELHENRKLEETHAQRKRTRSALSREMTLGLRQ